MWQTGTGILILLIFTALNVNSHMWLVAAILEGWWHPDGGFVSPAAEEAGQD